MALIGKTEGVNLQKKQYKKDTTTKRSAYELTAIGDYDDEDNSDQYMAESIKEAEAEVKAAHGHEPDLSSKIK
jgi:hypothetical protein